jgi:RHS repeat-associated protein
MTVTRYTTSNGAIVSENRGGVLHDYVPSPLGNTLALLDNTQTQADQWSYMPYGESTRIKGNTNTPMLYVGRHSCRQDSSGTRSLMGLRVLDVTKGRWMTEDPIRFVGGDRNLYRYAGANPVSIVDPTGLQHGHRRCCCPTRQQCLCAPAPPPKQTPPPRTQLPSCDAMYGRCMSTAGTIQTMCNQAVSEKGTAWGFGCPVICAPAGLIGGFGYALCLAACEAGVALKVRKFHQQCDDLYLKLSHQCWAAYLACLNHQQLPPNLLPAVRDAFGPYVP